MSKKVSDVSTVNRDRSWGLWGNLSFAWANTPIRLARNGVLTLKDLYLPRNSTADVCYEDFCHEWESRTVVPDGEMSKRPLLRALLKLYGKRFFLGGVFKLAWSALVICGAFFFVRSLLLYVDEDEKDHAFNAEWKGWILATFFFIAATLWGLCLQRMGFICMSSAVKVRAALATAISRKAIQLNKISAEDTAAVVGFMANDLGKVYDGMLEFHYLWASPFEAFTIIGLLGSLVGKWALPAAGIVGIIIFIQYFFGWQIAMNKHKNSKNINERGHILQEILPAMKLVKYYAWEEFFEKKLKKIRARESKLAFANIFFKTMNICLVFTTPPLCASVIFATYEFSEGRLDPTIAFTTLTLFNILRFPLVVLPKALRAASEASTSLARIEKFLLDADKQINERAEADNDMHSEAALGIHVHRAAFRYEGHDGHGFKLTIPTFTCDPGEVVAVVGRVGAGKSALLDALLGNMPNEHGDCKVGGKLAYVPQTAWVQNMSIRDNITFGLPFDQERYNQVIHACALEQDLAMLPQGDESMGGLRGMNLSGGQRQRVNVARAAYFGADTILLDNALSAVDHHTAEHMFTNCIKGLFASKAVVLVTHQLQFIRRCDKVAIVDHGKIQYFGPFNPTAQQILASYLPVPDEDTAGHAAGEDRRPKPKKDAQVTLAKPEAKPRTSLPMGAAFKRYLNAGPAWKFYISVASGLVSQASRQMSDFWIRAWASDGYGHYLDRAIEKHQVGTNAAGQPLDEQGRIINDPDNYDDLNGGYASQIYAGLYGAFTFAFWFIQVLRTGGFFLAGKAAADRIMRRSVHRVLYSPMGLYLAKPVGELLASFSSDQDKIDEALPDALHLAFVYAFIILSTAVTISVNIREFIAFAAVLIIVTAVMLKLYLPAATQVKHLRATSAGSLVGLSAEVLEGLKVVQAYRHQNHFVREFTNRTDEHHASIFNADSLNLWISFYCDFYGAVMLLALCYFAVAFAERGSAVVGLAFSNTIQLLVFYTWTLRLTTESISLAGSCEQLCWLAYKAPIDGQDDINNAGQTLETGLKWRQLKNIVIEDKKESRNKSKMLQHWPVDGRIEFDNVVMRYRPTARPALNGVNLKIAHGEKVGIVGRTGSGKSTLLMALYRMFDLAEGTITVGGIDINLLPLRRARRGLSIIPQEPVMFSGTLRENLDPYHEHSDFELYNLLVEAGLKEKAEAAGGLDGHVDGSGSDQWSVGQCQLVCLVRAALNKVPVVCMDEATAALDPHTEEIVLEVANRLFEDRTTLTIAHRLEAVIECDTAVVMEQGKVAETGSPDTLLTDPNSWFTKLVEMAGPAEAASLRAAAKAHFEKRANEYHQEGEYHP